MATSLENSIIIKPWCGDHFIKYFPATCTYVIRCMAQESNREPISFDKNSSNEKDCVLIHTISMKVIQCISMILSLLSPWNNKSHDLMVLLILISFLTQILSFKYVCVCACVSVNACSNVQNGRDLPYFLWIMPVDMMHISLRGLTKRKNRERKNHDSTCLANPYKGGAGRKKCSDL